MILVQNFMLVNNHVKTLVWKAKETKLLIIFKFSNHIQTLIHHHKDPHWPPPFAPHVEKYLQCQWCFHSLFVCNANLVLICLVSKSIVKVCSPDQSFQNSCTIDRPSICHNHKFDLKKATMPILIFYNGLWYKACSLHWKSQVE